MKRMLSLLAVMALSACDDAPAPAGVTPDEADALDQAAAMVEGRRMPEELSRPRIKPVEAPVPPGAR